MNKISTKIPIKRLSDGSVTSSIPKLNEKILQLLRFGPNDSNKQIFLSPVTSLIPKLIEKI